jgi:hypothetical protein
MDLRSDEDEQQQRSTDHGRWMRQGGN